MIGRRVYPDANGVLSMSEGDYGKHIDGTWHVRPPGCSMGELDGHTVTEHEDGTITASPSIVAPHWHGYLERGVWRSA